MALFTQQQQHSSFSRRGLKRTRPKFVSPLLANKKPRSATDEVEKQTTTMTQESTESKRASHDARARLDFTDTQSDTKVAEDGEILGHDSKSLEEMEQERRALEKRLKEKEEELRKLKLVKMYRAKNNLEELERLTAKWREVSQEAAESLLASSTHVPRPSMAQMLDYLHINHDLIRYSVQDESFY